MKKLFKKFATTQKGTTLLELLLYIALSAILLVGVLHLSTFVVIDDRSNQSQMMMLLELEKTLQETSKLIIKGDPAEAVTVTSNSLEFTDNTGQDIRVYHDTTVNKIMTSINGTTPYPLHSDNVNVTNFTITRLNASSDVHLFELFVTGESGYGDTVSFRTAASFTAKT